VLSAYEAAASKARSKVCAQSPGDPFAGRQTGLDLFRAVSSNAPALFYFDARFTYRELDRLSDRLAGWWAQQGVSAGDRAAVILQNTPQFVVAVLAAWKVGAIIVTLNPMYRTPELTRLFKDCEPRTILCHGDQWEVVAPAAATFVKPGLMLWTDGREFQSRSDARVLPEESDAPAEPSLSLALAQEPPPPPTVPLNPEDVALLLYTSGTTGLPKPVEVSHLAFTSYAAHMVDDRDHVWPSDSGYYSPWSAAHALGFIALAAAVQRGQRLVVRDGFSEESYWSDIRSYDCQLTVALNIGQLLWDSEPRADDGRNPLHTMIMVPLIPQFRAFGDRFAVRIATLYGMTEIGPALRSLAPTTHAVAGHPSSGYEVRLVDTRGTDVAPGEAGELIVRHVDGAIASGYAHLPVETENAWRDGWFHTGDRFRDCAGELRYIGRLTDSIRHRGRNISPRQIEEEVRMHPAIAECACVGHTSGAHSKYGESDQDVRLFLVVKQGRVLSVEELIDYLRPRLPPYMLPRYYDVLAKMPTSVSGRIIRSELAKRPLGAGTVERASTRSANQPR